MEKAENKIHLSALLVNSGCFLIPSHMSDFISNGMGCQVKKKRKRLCDMSYDFVIT